MPNPGDPVAGPTPTPVTGERVLSVDALRGFDMFWILGADALVYALEKMSGGSEAVGRFSFSGFIGNQLRHVEWQGFHFYDLIFPLFVFIVGVSLVFSLTRTLREQGRTAAYGRIFRRSGLLFLIALLYSGGFSNEWPNMRLLGVLNRIALAYLFAGLFFCHFRARGLAVVCATLLLGYWGLMTWVPFPDVPLTPDSPLRASVTAAGTYPATLFADAPRTQGDFSQHHNLANYVDARYLPGRKYDGFWDPEGLLSTIPAIATCLFGVFAGLLLQRRDLAETRKVQWLLLGGLAAVVAGWLWGLQFPVIKKIWTSSYVLVAAGYSAWLLALFHYLIEVRHYRRWVTPFIWIGANAITLYLLNNLIGWRKLATRFAGGDVKNFLDRTVTNGFGDLVIALVGLALVLLVARFLYRRRIFLRL